jgi:ubiquinone/menaquinone biosynthesis C-methylase UbiE
MRDSARVTGPRIVSLVSTIAGCFATLPPMSVYDVVAPSFDSFRVLPAGVPEAIRAAVLRASALPHPRLLDLGAGSGRVGWPFVVAGDNYVGVDLSIGMLREFAQRAVARLAQADGQQLPFRNATFDTVMLIQVFGGLRGWKKFIAEARRVLRPAGVLIVGRTSMPPDGVDARMKQRLAVILDQLGVQQGRANARGDIVQWLESSARSKSVTAATWTASRMPRGFIERHGSGARFSVLPAHIKAQALRDLGAWAAETFGTLDKPFSEQHSFELQIFRFQDGN